LFLAILAEVHNNTILPALRGAQKGSAFSNIGQQLGDNL